MPENLLQHRGELNVWERSGSYFSLQSCDSERWIASLSAGALLFWALKRRSPAGLILVAGSAALGWWAALGPEERRERRSRFADRLRGPAGDMVHEAAEESFPASDAPAWTSSAGSTSRPGAACS